MSMICLRRRFRSHFTMLPVMAMAPSPRPANKPIDSRLLSPPDIHSIATNDNTANAPIPVASFMRACFRCFSASHHKSKQKGG